MMQFASRAKYDAWNALGNLPQDKAELEYISLANELWKQNGENASEDSKYVATSTLIEENQGNQLNQTDNAPVKSFLYQIAFPKKINNILTLKLNNIKISLQNHILTITLNRPNRSNAFDMNMWSELKLIFENIQYNESIRVIKLQGEGDHFSSGMDLSVFSELDNILHLEQCEARRREALSEIIQYFQQIINNIELCPIPVIAMISGHCIGGAIDLITACDMVYCTFDASFSVKEVDLAIVADLGTIQRLPKLIGYQQTRELAYTGKKTVCYFLVFLKITCCSDIGSIEIVSRRA